MTASHELFPPENRAARYDREQRELDDLVNPRGEIGDGCIPPEHRLDREQRAFELSMSQINAYYNPEE